MTPLPSAVVADAVVEILKTVSRRPIEPTPDSDLIADLGFDSLQVMETVAELEDRFDIVIAPEDVPNARTVAQITAKVERDLVEWNARIEALRNVALEALDVVKRKDVKELWDVGENLDKACEACHRSYWYPGEGAEFYEKLRRRIEEHQKQRGAAR